MTTATRSIIDEGKKQSKGQQKRLGWIARWVKNNPVRTLYITSSLFFISLAAILYLSYSESQTELMKYKESTGVTSTAELLSIVSKLTEVPENETPTVATIKDAKKLKDQAFFARAENGDKLLIYKQNRRAILYRPSTNKVIESMTVNLEALENAANETRESTSSEDVKAGTDERNEPKVIRISIYNGTQTAGLAADLSQKLNTNFRDLPIELTAIGNAANVYENTLVINIGNIPEVDLQKIAEFAGGRISDLPSGESVTSADVLILIGTDYSLQ